MSARVFKVQKPLSSNSPNPGWLVYPQSRDLMFEMVPTAQMVKMMGDDVKMYVLAEASQVAGKVVPDFKIIERVGHQPW